MRKVVLQDRLALDVY